MNSALLLLLADASALNAGRDLEAPRHVKGCQCQDCDPVPATCTWCERIACVCNFKGVR